jgi:hypothetical protein
VQARGGNNFGEQGRGGGQGQSHAGRGVQHNRGCSRGGHSNNRGAPSQRGGSTFHYGQQHQYTPPAQAPTAAYAIPPFVTSAPGVGHVQPQANPAAFAQAMSFMATPAGAQSMAAFASHMASAGSSPYAQPSSPQQVQPPPRYSTAQQSGQKRKWTDRTNNGNIQPPPQPQLQRKQQQGPKPPRAKAAVPPSIPTFGFSLPKPPPAPPSRPAHTSNVKKPDKGRVRLGLTLAASSDESSEDEDDDVDEEVVLGAALKGGGFAFEHGGEHISLQTAGDLVEWIKDRRRNFPTQQKAIEKAHAGAMKRKNELEFVRRLKGRQPRPEYPPRQERAPKVREPSVRDEKKQEELAALRKRLHESMQKKQEATDLGLGYGSETESGDDSSSILSESSVVSSSDEDSDDSDAAPEPTSSKVAPPPIKVPPPAQPQMPRKPDKERVCLALKKYGKCPYGHSCKFKHPKKEEKRMGLYEKLVEQELVKADQLALDAIKFLGQNGFLG